MIPADLRIIQARDLFVAQASLTGESLPVEKVAATREPRQNNPLECDTLCFMGTNVVSGTAQAVVMATGADTWFGQLAGRVSDKITSRTLSRKELAASVCC
ncbi:magnesium-transporting ATPase MgtA [Salmonella enterica subsp. enterica]|nr:magnesium-transporting ATPase MgtA [Salmonella enterica subsp. enterica]